MKLFKYENFEITISEEAFLIKEFKAIIDRDKSKNKSVALKELAYIYFFHDPRSDYFSIIDKDLRSLKIKQSIGLDKNWSVDKELENAILVYNELSTTMSSLLLEDTMIAVDKIRAFLREIDLKATDKNEKPLYTLNSITSTIRQIPSFVKDLIEAEAAVHKEIYDKTRMRGKGDKSILEDGLI